MPASDTQVQLNEGAGGAEAAVVQDSGGAVHQKIILETQTGSADPSKLTSDGSGNLNVNLNAGGLAGEADGATFTAGTTAGLPFMAAAGDTPAAVTDGDLGVPGMTTDRALKVAGHAATTGGWTPGHVVSAASTNAAVIKSSAGQLGSIIAGNSGAGWAYVKFYDKATTPAPATDTPKWVVPLPPGGGACPPIPPGLKFTTGIGIAITGGSADNDATNVAAGQVVASYGFI